MDKGKRFSKIVQDKDLLSVLVDYLQSIHAQEGFEFWVEVELFKRLSDKTKMEKAVKRITKNFIKCGAVAEINIDAKLREDIFDKLKSGIWDQTLFNKTQEHIIELIQANCLKGQQFTNHLERYKSQRHLQRDSTRSLEFYKNIEKYWKIRKGEKKASDPSKSVITLTSFKKMKRAIFRRQKTADNINEIPHEPKNWVTSLIQESLMYERRCTF